MLEVSDGFSGGFWVSNGFLAVCSCCFALKGFRTVVSKGLPMVSNGVSRFMSVLYWVHPALTEFCNDSRMCGIIFV